MTTHTLQQPDIKPRGWCSTRWRRFALAVTFLTRLPLPVRGEVTTADLRASMGWYPLLGLGLGAGAWALYWGGCKILPTPLLAAALVIVLAEAVTGALHLDGLMDTCDGLGSGAPRERALEIMKDSRTGAMGAFGAIAVLIVKIAALAALAPSQAILPLLVGLMTARLTPIWAVTLFPYARAKGTGGAFAEGRAPAALIFATVTTLAAAFAVNWQQGPVLALLIVACVLLMQARIAQKLGGLTGDVYGMGIELGEVTALVVGCVVAKIT